MLPPEFLKKAEEQILRIYGQLELDIIEEIATRIANFNYANTVVINDVKIAQEMGLMYEDVIKMVSSYNNQCYEEVQRIFEEAGIKTLKYDDNIYREAGLKPIPINQSKSMLQLISATALKTNSNLQNLCMTTANTAQTQFYNGINKAYLDVSTGLKSYSSAIIDTIKEISEQGTYIEYPSGQHRTLESAVRTNIVTSVNQTCGKLQEMRAEELGWDLMELTAHGGARPEHAEWQGKIVSRRGQKGYLTLDDIGYGEATGFKGVNCRHDWRPYYKGSSKTYTDEELKDMKNKKVTYQGKEISKYDASQIQRRMERQIRQDKKDTAGMQAAALNSKDEKVINQAKEKLIELKIKQNKHNNELNNLLDETGLRKDYSRLSIRTFNNVSTKTNIGDKIIKNNNNEVKRLQYIGKIDKSKIGEYSKKIATDDVIITNERIEHTKKRHPGDYEKYIKYVPDIINNPDYVLEDKDNIDTLLMLKTIRENSKNVQVVLKLQTNINEKDKSNSVITFWHIRNRNYRNTIKNNKLIFEKLDNNE